MKKNFDVGMNAVKVALVCALVYVLLTLGVCGLASSAHAETYPRVAVIDSVDREGDVITCVDASDNVWAFAWSEEWLVGDVCVLMLDAQHTAEVEDDVIVDVWFDSTADEWMARVCN